ncbi:MAG: VCBS repeat-containing protein [Planctomycetota bacterium]
MDSNSLTSLRVPRATCALGALAVALIPTALGAPHREALSVSLPDAVRFTGAFGRPLLLDANGDRRVDVVSLFGDVPVVIYSPSMSQVSLPITGYPALDIAVLPGGDADDLLVSHAAGVTQFHYGEGAANGRAGYEPVFELGAPFSGCRALAVHDFDADGIADLAALAADGSTVLRARGLAQGGFVVEPGLALATPATQLRAVEWLGGPAFALVQPTASGDELRVVDLQGALLDGVVAPGGIVDLTPIREAASSAGSIALLDVSPGGLSRVTVLRAGGFIDGPLALGAMDAIGLHACDFEATGDQDLVVTGRGDGYLRTLRHGGLGAAAYPSALVGLLEVLDESIDPSGQRARAVAADFDHDGDLDVFHLCEALRDGVLSRDDTILHTGFAPELVWAWLDYDGPAPHAVFEVSPRPLRSGALPTHVVAELWAELPIGIAFFRGLRMSFLMGKATVAVDPLDPNSVLRIDAPTTMGDHAWIILRGLHDDGTNEEIGTDEVFGFVNPALEGGGSGSSNNGQNGVSPTPPPPHIRPVPLPGGN